MSRSNVVLIPANGTMRLRASSNLNSEPAFSDEVFLPPELPDKQNAQADAGKGFQGSHLCKTLTAKLGPLRMLLDKSIN